MGGSLDPEGGLELMTLSISFIWTRNFLISSFCMSIIFSISVFSSDMLRLFSGLPGSSSSGNCCCLRMTPNAVSRSWTWVRAILSSRLRSFISLMRVTFSYKKELVLKMQNKKCFQPLHDLLSTSLNRGFVCDLSLNCCFNQIGAIGASIKVKKERPFHSRLDARWTARKSGRKLESNATKLNNGQQCRLFQMKIYHKVKESRPHLHNSDVICSVNLGILRKLLS